MENMAIPNSISGTENFANVSTTFNNSILNTFTNATASHPLLSSIPEPSPTTQLIVSFLLIFAAVLLEIGLRQLRKHKWGPRKHSDDDGVKNQRVAKTVDDFPSKSHFSFKLPTILEGLLTLNTFKNDGVKFLDDMGQKYGQIYQAAILTENVLVVNNPDLIKAILGSTETYVLNKPRSLYDVLFPEWLRDGLLASDVDVWAPHRKMVARTLTYKVLPSYLKMMNKHSKNLLADLVSCSSPQGVTEGQRMYDLIYSHSIKIISEIVFGPESSSENHSDQFHEHFKQFKQLAMTKLWNPLNIIPPIWWLNPYKKKYDHHASEVRKYIEADIEKCKAENAAKLHKSLNANWVNGADGVKPFRSLIEEMVHCKASQKEIADEVGNFLVAGHETTDGAIVFLMQHLAENPEVQAKCREELDSLFDSENFEDEDLTMDDLSSLKYLERCILETLRITTSVPVFLRQLSAPMETDDWSFKNGQVFAFFPWVLHRDPKNFPNPEKFDPDRFLPENVKIRHPSAFIPFGHGARNCIGSKLAMMEMKVIMVWMLRHFDLHTTDRLQDRKIMFEITTFAEPHYNVLLTQRKRVPSLSLSGAA